MSDDSKTFREAVEAESFAGVLCGKGADGWDEMLARI